MNISKFVGLRRASLIAGLCLATGSWAQTAPATAKPAVKAAVQVEGAWARATVQAWVQAPDGAVVAELSARFALLKT